MKEKITVVIPTFNRSMLLIRCIQALSAQALAKSNFEVIVVSDGADAQTKRALIPCLKKDGLNLLHLQTPEKRGPASARNLGWLSAKAPLIAFTDDDCIPEKDWLKAFLEHYSGQDYLALTGKTVVPLPEKPTDFAINIAQLETADFITANCACTRAALVATGGFDERFKMAWREDSDLEFKLLTHHIPIIPVSRAEVVHPVRSVPWGISIQEQKKGIYDALLFKKFPELYRRKIQAASIWRYYTITFLFILLLFCIEAHAMFPIFLLLIALISQFSILIFKRLKNRHKSISHVTEMITTSLIIPFISVFWRIYGAIKYRVFFI